MKKQRVIFILFSVALLFCCSAALVSAFTLPDTGQTKCYGTTGAEIACAGTGQDGALSGAQNNCAASVSVSPSLVVHIPIVTYSGYNFWVDLTYNAATSAFPLTNAGIVSDMTPYSNCAASTLSSDFILHIPALLLGNNSYWVFLQYNGSGFVITAYGQNPPSLSGRVVKGPLSGATVNFFALNSDGSKGALIGHANTDSHGDFTVNLTATPQLPILAEASGGSYVNEISGVPETLLSTDILTAVLPAGTTVAAVTPLTHMAATRARVLAVAGSPLSTAVNAANIGVAQQYQLMDIIGTLPVAINDAAQMVTASREQREYGLVLAGITQVAANLNVRPIDLAKAFAIDMEDGILDGLGQAPIPIPTISGPVIFMPPGTAIQNVGAAINLLLSSDVNVTNLAGKSISLVPVKINPIGVPFFITSTALPAWVEGPPPHTATITASAPCTWTIPPPSVLPNWLQLNAPAGLSQAAALTGTAPLLPGGSTQSISAPFVVQCQNFAGAIYAIQWTITIVKAPPVLIPIPAACIAGTQGIALPVATATGGVPPYYFMSPSFMYGAPPLGTSVWTNGTLRGTCPVAGIYIFPVLAVDSIGAHSDPLANVTLTVTPAQCIYVYSDWSVCQPDNTQTRTVISSSPAGCIGTPILTQSCTYVPQSCTFSISPTSKHFGSSGGNGSVTVTASDSSCPWKITNSLSWVTITAVSGSGTGTVAYSVSANIGTSQRSGTITIAGQTFTVTQDGAPLPPPSSAFKGSITGAWQGTCPSFGGASVKGGFSMNIDANGIVTGSYSGSDSGSINGTVNTSGNFSAGGSAGGAAWNGHFSVSGTTLSGSGTWSDPDCSGSWSGTGYTSQ